ncbi:FAD binding domain protein [Aspergillus bombycis]|uniref:FAD binding domain protein n=1 Tax=Aspergillus bombycis TaxID=109264 RepID=A0A1F8A845_9EURO|nr:FAD binding domain protein [Aspergillus bombycis]OGM47861.1 FAD binding domain protein [Aspergillus bombycis]
MSIEELLLKAVPGPRPLPFKVIRTSLYRVHQLCASIFNRGRCALAGDAAHLNNPMEAMGLTTGLIDSEGLADALELIIHERKPMNILETYSDDRQTVFRTFVDPTPTQNKLRCASDAGTAKEDWLIRLMAKMENAPRGLVAQGTQPFFTSWTTNLRQAFEHH